MRAFATILVALVMVSPVFAISKNKVQSQLPYYDRKLDGPLSEVLCLNSRQNVNPLIFGHTALTTFQVDTKESARGKIVTDTAQSAGFWPIASKDKTDPDHPWVDLQFDNPAEYFLSLSKNSQNVRVARFCVPISKNESKKLADFYKKKKKSSWQLAYNCNDISTEAFQEVTGIELHSRSSKSGFLSIPKNVIDSIEKVQRKLTPKGLFTFSPQSSQEKKLLLDNIAKQQKLDVSEDEESAMPVNQKPYRSLHRGNR